MGGRLLNRQIVDQVFGGCHVGRELRVVQQQFHVDWFVADSISFRGYFSEFGHGVGVGGGQLHVDAIRQFFRRDTQVFEYAHGLVTHGLDLDAGAGFEWVELGPYRGQLFLGPLAVDADQGGDLFGQYTICVS